MPWHFYLFYAVFSHSLKLGWKLLAGQVSEGKGQILLSKFGACMHLFERIGYVYGWPTKCMQQVSSR